MHREHHRWYSQRLGKEMGINVYGHYGWPIVAFPTSAGDEREVEGQGMIPAIAHHIEAGKVKFYCVNAVNNESFYNKQASPAHRSWLQVKYDEYLAQEVAPFIHWHCRTPGMAISTTGASFGAYHAVNTVLKHPDIFRRCIAQSGVYDLRSFMNGHYDDNFYFNNPVDYVKNLSDPWYLNHLSQCDIRLATGNGPYEDSRPSYALSDALKARGIPHSVDDWGALGGHDWPYWKHQMNEYLSRLF